MFGLSPPLWVRWAAVLALAVASFAAGGALVADHFQGVIAKDSLAQSQGVVGSLIAQNKKVIEQSKIIGAANEKANQDSADIDALGHKLGNGVRIKTVYLNTICPGSDNPAGTGVSGGLLSAGGSRIVLEVGNLYGYRQDTIGFMTECENQSKEVRRLNAQIKAISNSNQ